MEVNKIHRLERAVERYALLLVVLIVVNIGLVYFLRSQVHVISLLKQQQEQLTNDQKVLASSTQIYETYKDHIDDFNAVFPDEETVLTFLQVLEQLTKNSSDASSVKFASLTPIVEADKLFLLFTISMRTDKERLSLFLEELESIPYMTRVLGLTVTWADQSQEKIDTSLKLKLYVKNPFSAK